MLVKLKLKIWDSLIRKLRYLRKECKKKDKVIKAQKAQINSLRESFTQTKIYKGFRCGILF